MLHASCVSCKCVRVCARARGLRVLRVLQVCVCARGVAGVFFELVARGHDDARLSFSELREASFGDAANFLSLAEGLAKRKAEEERAARARKEARERAKEETARSVVCGGCGRGGRSLSPLPPHFYSALPPSLTLGNALFSK